MISSVTDLNRECKGRDHAMKSIAGANYVCGKAVVYANHGASAAAHVSTTCGPLCGRAEGEVVLVLGSVPVPRRWWQGMYDASIVIWGQASAEAIVRM
jgi:hypothetical protein